MKKGDFEKYRLDQHTKLAIFTIGMFVALVLALTKSPYTGEAFALLAGLLGGTALPVTK